MGLKSKQKELKVVAKVEIVNASKAANKLTMGNHLNIEQHPLNTSWLRQTQDPPGVNPRGDTHPDAWDNGPDRTSRKIITHDPLEGFPEGRKEREPPVSKEVIDAWRVPSIRQNFCVEDYIKFRKCQLREHPMAWNCHRELHVADGDDLAVGKLVGLLEGGGGSSGGHLLLEVQGDVAELLLDVTDNLALG